MEGRVIGVGFYFRVFRERSVFLEVVEVNGEYLCTIVGFYLGTCAGVEFLDVCVARVTIRFCFVFLGILLLRILDSEGVWVILRKRSVRIIVCAFMNLGFRDAFILIAVYVYGFVYGSRVIFLSMCLFYVDVFFDFGGW